MLGFIQKRLSSCSGRSRRSSPPRSRTCTSAPTCWPSRRAGGQRSAWSTSPTRRRRSTPARARACCGSNPPQIRCWGSRICRSLCAPRARARDPVRGRQHRRDAAAPAPARARSERRAAQRDEGDRRPFRPAARRGGHRARRRCSHGLREARALHGATPGALEVYLCLRGLRTMPLRMERSQHNALELARRLEAHPQVREVRYLGLESHPQHERGGGDDGRAGVHADVLRPRRRARADALLGALAAADARDEPRSGRDDARAPRPLPRRARRRPRGPAARQCRVRARRGPLGGPRAGAGGDGGRRSGGASACTRARAQAGLRAFSW